MLTLVQPRDDRFGLRRKCRGHSAGKGVEGGLVGGAQADQNRKIGLQRASDGAAESPPRCLFGTELVEDEQELIDSLQDLVNKYEDPESTYSLNDVDPNYMGGLSKGIVGFKIKINKIEGKAKLSQNHSVERRNLVVEKLEKVGSEGSKRIAELMRK